MIVKWGSGKMPLLRTDGRIGNVREKSGSLTGIWLWKINFQIRKGKVNIDEAAPKGRNYGSLENG